MMDWPVIGGDSFLDGGEISEDDGALEGYRVPENEEILEESIFEKEFQTITEGHKLTDLDLWQHDSPPCEKEDKTVDDPISRTVSRSLSPNTPPQIKTEDDECASEAPLSRTLRVELPSSTLLTPRSHFEPFEPGIPIVSETEAVFRLSQEIDNKDEFVEFQLDDFAVYCDTRPHYPEEMRPLHHLGVKFGVKTFYFDGRLSVGKTAFFVRRVQIAALPIGDYGDLSKHTVRDKIWLRSELNANREIYYRLRTPALEYRRFFSPFLWVADLAKHLVDFLKIMGESRRQVTILHFRTTFSTWASKTHKKAPEFIAWRKQFPGDDFRASIVGNLGFLYKEVVGVLGAANKSSDILWAEILNHSRYKSVPCNVENPPTVVTKYIFDCFSHLPFGDRLEAVNLSKETQTLRNKLIQKRHLELPAPIHQEAKSLSTAAKQQIQDIKPGDTISTHRDGADSGTRWRRDVSRGFNDVDRWFALVQAVHVDGGGRRSFDVIWYYRAVDTLCGVMKYPWNNELFLSDHCSCGEDSKILEKEVLGVHDIEFGGTSASRAELFCRQTYVHRERKWITLQQDHMHCPHAKKKPKKSKYQPGETLLVVLDRSTGRSEPCEFVASRKENTKLYCFRRLLRRIEVDPKSGARPNELVYSEQLFEMTKRRVRGPCSVRFFKEGEPIPTPYDRDGVGGFFYITHQEVYGASGSRSYAPLGSFPVSLRQGHDPDEDIPRLRGLDLFCGGGNFGRGLEDGGGIEMKWANDYDAKAIHTYMANVSSPEAVSPFLGSIDDLQRQAIRGRFCRNVPRIGDVDFISGGSPCPGFSHLTNDKTTPRQRKNQSLIAAFASFIDLYRPQYGLLENVPGIVQKKANRDQDVFSQLICAVVGLGYQTHFFFLDASSCGSPQRRSRVFLAFAAPGLQLPRRPDTTHAHPPDTRSLSLGNLPTGEPMAERMVPDATPFDFVPASAATADLPPVYDSKPDICVPFPDHRISIGLTKQLRIKVNLIPIQPWGMNFAQAWFGMDRRSAGSGVLTTAERAMFPQDSGNLSLSRTSANSNAYGRQFPNRLIETVVTSQSPSDAKNGRTLHWREGRVLTIMEARRAQGFRDDDVLLGLPADQYRIVGNSVAREVAVALGVVFREAWAQSLADDGHRRGIASAASAASLPAPAGTKTCPLIIHDPCSSESNLDTEPEDLTRLRSSPYPPTATVTPDTTPPPPHFENLCLLGSNKRARSASITVEIRVPKIPSTVRGESPSRAAVRQTSVNAGVLEPSPLGQSVIVLDQD